MSEDKVDKVVEFLRENAKDIAIMWNMRIYVSEKTKFKPRDNMRAIIAYNEIKNVDNEKNG